MEIDLRNRTVKDGRGRSYPFELSSTILRPDARECRACGGGDARQELNLKVHSPGEPNLLVRLCDKCLIEFDNHRNGVAPKGPGGG